MKTVWSVVLPLVSRIINKTYRDYLGCCPNDLVYLVPSAVERVFEGVFEPEKIVYECLPIIMEFMNERLLDQASLLLYDRQGQLAGQAAQEKNFGVVLPYGTS